MLRSSNPKCPESEEGPAVALPPLASPQYLVTIPFIPHWWDSSRNTQYQMNDEWASQGALVIKNLPANAGGIGDRSGSIYSGSGRSPGIRNGNALQYSCLGVPWTEETGGLQSMGSQRVSHNWKHLILFFGITLWGKFYKFPWKRRAQRLDKPFLLS